MTEPSNKILEKRAALSIEHTLIASNRVLTPKNSQATSANKRAAKPQKNIKGTSHSRGNPRLRCPISRNNPAEIKIGAAATWLDQKTINGFCP